MKTIYRANDDHDDAYKQDTGTSNFLYTGIGTYMYTIPVPNLYLYTIIYFT